MNPTLLVDGYKVGHVFQYPKNTEYVYSNFTPRNTRRTPEPPGIVAFGLQYFLQEYLTRRFTVDFFDRPRDEVVSEYERRIDNYLGPGWGTSDHIGALHDLGYLPLFIKAVPEGTVVPYGVPILTIVNTVPEFYWLTNMLETLMSSVLWLPSTSATTAMTYRTVFDRYAQRTGASPDFVPFQGHDFSFRGMCGTEAAMLSGAGHLLSFVGTDTVPAIGFLEEFYGADVTKEVVGLSVPATEHSVMCMTEPNGELEAFRNLITKVYPNGIVSIVSDTWDLWRVLTEYLPTLQDEVLARNGTLVIRPDSGDPVKILCGDGGKPFGSPANKGVIQLLWDLFGGTTSNTGHRILNSHIGSIYGDGISPERQLRILSLLSEKGFASSNVVLGLGSYSYQFVTRDTDGWAMKATAGCVGGKWVEIFKDPVTDDGGKRSARGLLCVDRDSSGRIVLEQCVTPQRETEGLLLPVFRDGRILRRQTLAEIRALVGSQR